nr:MerR family transcriptional regulator [Enterococcus sp. MJM12]
MYSIKEVAELFGLSVYTLRYYDKAGLLPFVSKNEAGYRVFTESDLGFIQTICCLKDTGMPVKTIKVYIDYCMEGTKSIPKRCALLAQHRQNVLAEIESLQQNLKEVDEKLATYTSPEAVKVVAAMRQFSSAEKERYGLYNPYR